MMMSRARRCRECVFYSLASEGLDPDWCRHFERELTRAETVVGTRCESFIERVDERDADYYLPEKAEQKREYEREIRRYSIYMLLLLGIGIVLFYLVTAIA